MSNMTAVMSKSSYAAPHSLTSHRQHAVAASHKYSTAFSSPTDSEFSVGYEDPDSVRNWDEDRVVEWLKSINAGHYADRFRGMLHGLPAYGPLTK